MTSKALRRKIIDDGVVLLHYGDSKDIDPENYSDFRGAKPALKGFNDLNENGGWVIADYPPMYGDDREIWMGEIEKESFHTYSNESEKCLIDHKHGKSYSHVHNYKALKMKGQKKFDKNKNPLLRLPFGRGTVFRINAVSPESLISIYEERGRSPVVESLEPFELELICHEYLRKCPKWQLDYLVSPIGRSMEGVDIVGRSFSKDRTIYAQITAQKKRTEISRKVKKLLACQDSKHDLIYFGPKKEPVKDQGVFFIEIEAVFDWMEHKDEMKEMRKILLNQ